jgi:peroxiredoxin
MSSRLLWRHRAATLARAALYAATAAGLLIGGAPETFGLTGQIGPAPQEAPKAPKRTARVDQTVEDFKLPDIMAAPGTSSGAAHSILQHKGEKVVVLFFLMEKCSHTKKYAARVMELVNRYKDDAVFYGVRSHVEDRPEGVRKLARQIKLTIPILDDAEGAMARYFRVRIAPTFVVIDREGVMRYFGGFDNDSGHSVRVDPALLLAPAIRATILGERLLVNRGLPNGCAIQLPAR